MPYLNARVVAIIYSTCAARAEETGKDIIDMPVPGTSEVRRFSVARLAQERDSIIQLLQQLPKSFSQGLGSQIADAVRDHRGNEWTYTIEIAIDLMMLGIALGIVRFYPFQFPEADGPGGVLYRLYLPQA